MRFYFLVILNFVLCLKLFSASYYNIGSPALTDIWVDHANGNDSNNGNSRTTAYKTIGRAWSRVPGGTLSGTGYRILLAPGDYPESSIPVYWENKHGSAQFPIIVQSADASSTDGSNSSLNPRLHGYLNLNNIRYIYFINVNIVTDPGYGGGGNNIHFDGNSQYILLRNCKFDGFDGSTRQPQETIKINQCKYVYVENCNISGAFWFPLDYVAVQYGHIIYSKIHNAGHSAFLLKGGTAHILVEGNVIYDSDNVGAALGQGTGFEFMVSPYLHYEVYDIKFVNNILHNASGPGLEVAGGYNLLIAYNTFYRTGQNSHPVGIVFGDHSCDGNTAECEANRIAGGWGPTGSNIPNRNIYIYNNLIYNPPGYQSQWQHFTIFGPASPVPGSNTPNPALSDQNLKIRGNFIWNGPADLSLGIGESSGCQNSNPTCNENQLLSENTINNTSRGMPQLINPESGQYWPVSGGNVFNVTTYTVPNFDGGDAPSTPTVPAGNLNNTVSVDRAGNLRTASSPPGAYVAPGDTVPPSDPGTNPPSSLNFTVTILDGDGLSVTVLDLEGNVLEDGVISNSILVFEDLSTDTNYRIEINELGITFLIRFDRNIIRVINQGNRMTKSVCTNKDTKQKLQKRKRTDGVVFRNYLSQYIHVGKVIKDGRTIKLRISP